jgi:NAD(P)-dependent dehydrogenase (short-subunit alcohol dehydrogenase family)
MNHQLFEGKVALITGGGSGIGEACAFTFARHGAKVAISDLNVQLGEKVVAAIKRIGGDAIFLHVDVSDPQAVEKMVAETILAFGKLNLAVNYAGIEDWNKVINLNSVFLIA